MLAEKCIKKVEVLEYPELGMEVGLTLNLTLTLTLELGMKVGSPLSKSCVRVPGVSVHLWTGRPTEDS